MGVFKKLAVRIFASGLLSLALLLTSVSSVSAGWVNGYFRSNGTYAQGYWRTEPNYYKWDNYSFDNDWSDSYNDNSWYRSYGYDPEPLDDDYVSSYSRGYYYDSVFDYDDYDYDYNDDDSYDFWDW